MVNIFRVYENNYLQYKAGLYDEKEWKRISRGIGHFFNLQKSGDLVATIWERSSIAFDERFVEYVEELREER